MTKSIQII